MLRPSIITVLLFVITFHANVDGEEVLDAKPSLFRIEGKVFSPAELPQSLAKGPFAMESVRILVNGGEFVTFPRLDGSFELGGLPWGSYLVEVFASNYVYEQVKVDITSKGKIRARRITWIQPGQVIQVPYPVKLKPKMPYKFFQEREQWRITDFLFSPMVLMMVLPLILIMFLPKMMNDPEARKEMEQLQMPKYDMPEMSEWLTRSLGGGKTPSTSVSKKKK